eukprot:s181_g16.t1
MRGRLRTAWVREWVEMGSEKKLLGMTELGCADGCGRRGCKGVAGNVWREGAAGAERAWVRGGLRTCKGVGGNGWGDGAGGDERARMRKGWKWVRRSRWG